nr:hypothetical protein [Tanacetum cinerariifolium]
WRDAYEITFSPCINTALNPLFEASQYTIKSSLPSAPSVVPTSLSFLKASVDKVPVLRVQHQTAPSAVPTSLSFLKAPVDKVPVRRVQHQFMFYLCVFDVSV